VAFDLHTRLPLASQSRTGPRAGRPGRAVPL